MHPLRRPSEAEPLDPGQNLRPPRSRDQTRSPSRARRRGSASGPRKIARLVESGPGSAFAGPRALSETAWRALYEHHKDRVYLVCLRRTGNPSDALDASQETFIRVFANLERFRGHSLSSWIQVIALNASRDVRRKGDRRDRFSLEVLLDRRGGPRAEARSQDETWLSPELNCARQELEAAVERALAHLSPPLRQAVLLRYVEGLAYEDVATTLQVPLGTVKSRLARAHEALKRRLEPKLAAHGIG